MFRIGQRGINSKPVITTEKTPRDLEIDEYVKNLRNRLLAKQNDKHSKDKNTPSEFSKKT